MKGRVVTSVMRSNVGDGASNRMEAEGDRFVVYHRLSSDVFVWIVSVIGSESYIAGLGQKVKGWNSWPCTYSVFRLATF
jgi:hypothetical protein